MKLPKSLMLLLIGLLSQSTVFAQSTGGDFMRSMGKMYVVVAVVLAIFIGIVLFLVFLDRRITNIENQINNNG